VPVQKIGDVIASSGTLKALARQAQHLRDLQQFFLESTPAALAAASRVANLKAGTLLILADNAAVAAKLRQLAPRLLLHFKERGIEVTGIRVEVQVKPHKIKAEDDITKRSLPPDAIRDFSALSDALPASPLKSALSRLVARRRRPKPD
jgi:hypothetical protein